MKKILLVFAVVFVVYQTTSLRAVYGQGKKDEITAEEKKAANELADRFIQRLDETGDIEPLIKEMFVRDFIRRFVSNEKREGGADPAGVKILFVPGLEVDAKLLDQASEEDWTNLYVSSFDVMQYAFGVTFNAGADYYVKGKEPGDEALEKTLATMFPQDVANSFHRSPILKNFIKKEDSSLIQTLDELRDVNNTLAGAVKILHRPENAQRMRPTKNAIAAQKLTKQKLASYLDPYVEIGGDGMYGFPKGTRFVRVFATIIHLLLLVRIDGEYKIVRAEFGSPD